MVSSGTPVKLPVIDFSNQNLKPGSPEWDLAKHQVRKALEEYTCFVASLDQVVELRNAVFRAMEELFDLPSETKKVYASDKPFRGYSHPSVLLEGVMIDEAQMTENIEQGLTTLWPHGNINFSKTLVSFTELSTRLEQTIMRMILEGFGVDKYADELTDNTNYMLKLSQYKATPNGEPKSGIIPHSDKNMLTLLYQNEVDGFQFRNKDGDWMNVKPSPNSFIVLVGESLQGLLNGGLSPCFHHVLMKGNKSRYVLCLFAGTRAGYHVKAPEELVTDENPSMFKPFDYEQYLLFYTDQILLGRAESISLQDYCGVEDVDIKNGFKVQGM